jgi:hypothetical protein
MPAPATKQTLMSAYARRDAAAFEPLFRTLAPRLLIFCRRAGHSGDVSEDLCWVLPGRAAVQAFGPGPASLAAMSGALVGQWLLATRCPVEHTALHLLLFHVTGPCMS